MSKLQLKKELQRLTKEQLIEQITELYDAYKPVKEYYKTRLNPNGIQELYEKYKAVIIDKFHPNKMMRNLRTCFPVAKKAIADFSALKPPPKLLADLMVTLAEKPVVHLMIMMNARNVIDYEAQILRIIADYHIADMFYIFNVLITIHVKVL